MPAAPPWTSRARTPPALRCLRWCDVELGDGSTKPRVHVRQTVTKAGYGPPKSGKARDVPLLWDVDAAQALRELPRRSSLVFCQPNGSPLASNARERACKATMRAAKPSAATACATHGRATA